MEELPDIKNTATKAGISPSLDFNPELFNGLPVATYTCNEHGEINYYNEAAAELWGRKPEKGEHWSDSWKIYRLNGEPLPAAECPMSITLMEQRPVTGEEIIVERPDGVRMNVLSYPKPIFNASGNMTGAINMLVDISEKKRKEDAVYENELKYRSLAELLEQKVQERTLTLKKSEERYHKMVEEVQDYAIVLLDKDGYIINWNMGAEKIKGYSAADIIGKNFRIFYRDSDRFDQLPEMLIQQAADTGRAMHEGWRVRKDGTEFWGSIVITALHDDQNNIIGFSKVTRDLTERKFAEDKIQDYARDIEFRNKQLEEYAYIASHDLQEPLRKIQVFSELLESRIDDKEAVKKNLVKINSSARRMSNLIKDVLKYSQLSRADELFTETDLNKVLEAVKEDYELLIEEKQVSIIHSNLPVIKGIPIQMHQLFSNIIGNAIKFSNEKPSIAIASEIATVDDLKDYPTANNNQEYCKLTFTDNGIGFDQQYGEQIFKMFKRLGENTGTGIGLALVKKIVENHNGYISVTSMPDAGTTFTILLPCE